MSGLEPGTSRLSLLSECAYHLRYIPVDPSAHKHSVSGPGPSGSPLLTLVINLPFSILKIRILIFLSFEILQATQGFY